MSSSYIGIEKIVTLIGLKQVVEDEWRGVNVGDQDRTDNTKGRNR